MLTLAMYTPSATTGGPVLFTGAASAKAPGAVLAAVAMGLMAIVGR